MSGGHFNYLQAALETPRLFLERLEETRALILRLCEVASTDVAACKAAILDSVWYYYLYQTQPSVMFVEYTYEEESWSEEQWQFNALFQLPQIMPVRLPDQTLSVSLYDIWYRIDRYDSGDSSDAAEEMRRYSAQWPGRLSQERVEEMGRFLFKLDDPELNEALRPFFA